MSLNRLNHSTTLFPSLQITPTPILRNKDIYIDTISLTGLVEALANPEIELTDKHIINLVLKYMYAFVDIDSLHQIVDIQDIDYLFSVGEKVFHFAHQKSNFLMTSDQYNRTISELSQEYPLVEVFDKNKYGLAMLSDIPSTVSIIKNIIQQKHNPQLSHGKYLGLDLGSGTGILLLAQYLQAKRNGFTHIENIGIEYYKDIQTKANTLVQTLGIGTIIAGDTTLPETYKNISGNITHISNETIPFPGQSMNRTEDPFLKNTYVLYTTLGNQIQKETTFFPNKIILKYNRFPYEATKENQFLHKEFADEEKGIKQAFPELSEREIAEEISPIGIELQEGKITDLENVGEEIEPYINQQPRKRRWKK